MDVDGECEVSGYVIGAAIDVHRVLGPGLLESAYRICLVSELRRRGIQVETEVPLEVEYRDTRIGCAYRIDMLVGDSLIVELKSVQALDDLHTAQLLTYLRLTARPLGLLINFNVPLLKDGIRRVVQTLATPLS